MIADRRLSFLARLTPAAERERYRREWAADLQAAAPDDVLHGATRVALARRSRWLARAATGGAGRPAALLAWALAVLALVAAWLFGGPLGGMLLLALLVSVAVLPLASLPGRGSGAALWCCALLALAGLGYFWWALGARLDAADAGTAEPAGTGLGGPALLVGVAALALGVALAVLRAARRPSR